MKNNMKAGYKKGKKKGVLTADKPRRPLSAYNIFFAVERMKIIREQERKMRHDCNHEDLPDLKSNSARAHVGFGNLASIVSKRWKNVDETYKKELEAMACREKIRYKKDMKEWTHRLTTKVMEQAGTHNAKSSVGQVKGSSSRMAKRGLDSNDIQHLLKLDDESPSASIYNALAFKEGPLLNGPRTPEYTYQDRCFPCTTGFLTESPPRDVDGTSYNPLMVSPSINNQTPDSCFIAQSRLPFNFSKVAACTRPNDIEVQPSVQYLCGLCDSNENILAIHQPFPRLPLPGVMENRLGNCVPDTLPRTNSLDGPYSGHSLFTSVSATSYNGCPELPKDPPIEFIQRFFGIDPRKNKIDRYSGQN